MQQVPAHSLQRSQSELLGRRCCITHWQLSHICMEPLLLPRLQLLCWSFTAVSGVVAYLFGRTQHCKLAFLARLTMAQADVKSVRSDPAHCRLIWPGSKRCHPQTSVSNTAQQDSGRHQLVGGSREPAPEGAEAVLDQPAHA